MSEPQPSPAPLLAYETPPGIAEDAQVWTDGKCVYARRNAVLPNRCVKCNSDECVVMKRRHLAWTPLWAYLLLFLGLPGILIIALLQKKAYLRMGFCSKCRRRYLLHELVAWALALSGVVVFVIAAGVNADTAHLMPLAPALILASLAYAFLMARRVIATHIDKQWVTFKGAGVAFLSTLGHK